jgi:hypothetical protein
MVGLDRFRRVRVVGVSTTLGANRGMPGALAPGIETTAQSGNEPSTNEGGILTRPTEVDGSLHRDVLAGYLPAYW